MLSHARRGRRRCSRQRARLAQSGMVAFRPRRLRRRAPCAGRSQADRRRRRTPRLWPFRRRVEAISTGCIEGHGPAQPVDAAVGVDRVAKEAARRLVARVSGLGGGRDRTAGNERAHPESTDQQGLASAADPGSALVLIHDVLLVRSRIRVPGVRQRRASGLGHARAAEEALTPRFSHGRRSGAAACTPPRAFWGSAQIDLCARCPLAERTSHGNMRDC